MRGWDAPGGLMKRTGHKAKPIDRRYAIVSDADLQAASARLAGSFRARRGEAG
jgi:hypothetical protein